MRIIQNLDPPGCAYRDIKESLEAQINNLDVNKSIKLTLHNYLDKLIENELSIEDYLTIFVTTSQNLHLIFGQLWRNLQNIY